MLMITGTGEGGGDRVLTLSHNKLGGATLRLYEKSPMSEFGGKLMASFKLNRDDLTELKRNL